MERRTTSLPFSYPSLLLLLSLLLLSSARWSQGAGVRAGDRSKEGESVTVPRVDVGVILDMNSWVGNVSWTCMQIALEDFDKAPAGYSSRLSLHLRDSESDVVTTAAAAVDLMKNVGVQAIIGPQTSTEAKFLVELGNRTQVPIISFSAKSQSLSSQQTPYFVRTAWNDSSQAKAIASIVQNFGWREVVPVYGDTDGGTGIIPYLVDALQDVGAHILYRCKIPLRANDQEIIAALSNLKYNRTRVFVVVDMTYDLAFKFFKKARDLEMMEYGYVWLTTYGLTDIVDLMGPPAVEVMQGVLGIKPYVRETNKLRDFRDRWRKRYYYKENLNSSISEPTVFGLWAYDTVWALAVAVHNAGITNSTFPNSDTRNGPTDITSIGQSRTGKTLLEKMLEVNFSGMAGKFKLIDGQLESGAFEIINVLGKGKRRVGFWTSTHGVSRHVDKEGGLRVVVWPGGETAAPKGWQWPTNGTLKIGVPVKPGFSEFVRDENGSFRGYCIEVFEAALHELQYNVSTTYVSYEDARGNMNGTYDELVYQVYLKNYDAVVGDITIIANRSLYVDFTLPFSESGVSMVVPIKDQLRKDAWTFLEPLTANLWLASGAFFVFTGFVVWFIEHRSNEEFRGRPAQQFGSVFYFSFSTLVFAHRESIVNNLSRIVVIIWVFVVLILQQSYTASLSSILTVQQLQPTVTDLDQLIRNGDYIGYLNSSFMPGLLSRLNVNSSKLRAYNSPEEYNVGLSSGEVAAIIDEIPYLKVFLSKFCNYTMIGPIAKVDGFGFAFPIGSPLVPDLNRAILNVTEGKKMAEFENKLYANGTCSNNGTSTTAPSSSSLTVKSFWGLFLITGVSSLSALILSIILFAYEHRDIWRELYSDKSLLQSLVMFVRLYSQFEPPSQNRKKEEPAIPQLVGDDDMASPNADHRPESPISFSNNTQRQFDSDTDLGTPFGGESEEAETDAEADTEEDGGGTPGREIASQVPDPPSFAEMLNERNR